MLESCKYYGRLGTAPVAIQFADNWKEQLEKKVTENSEMSCWLNKRF